MFRKRLQTGLLFLCVMGATSMISFAQNNSPLRNDLNPAGPLDAAAETRAGIQSFKAAQFDDAIKHYLKAIAAAPDQFQAYYDLGVLYVNTRRFAEAVDSLQNAERLNPDFWPIRRYLGFAFYKTARSELAVDQFKRELELNPSAFAHSNLGFAYADLKQFENAEQSFQRALTLNPKLAEAVTGLCMTYSASNQSEKALTSCGEAAGVYGDSAMIQYLFGEAQLNTKHEHEALQTLKRAEQLQPAEAQIQIALGETNLRLRQYEQARANFMLATQLNPNLSNSYLGLGVSYYQLRRFSEAKQSFDKAIGLAPDSSTVAHFNLAVTCLQSKLRECALEQYDILKSMDPTLSSKLFGNLFGGRVLNVKNIKSVPKP